MASIMNYIMPGSCLICGTNFTAILLCRHLRLPRLELISNALKLQIAINYKFIASGNDFRRDQSNLITTSVVIGSYQGVFMVCNYIE